MDEGDGNANQRNGQGGKCLAVGHVALGDLEVRGEACGERGQGRMGDGERLTFNAQLSTFNGERGQRSGGPGEDQTNALWDYDSRRRRRSESALRRRIRVVWDAEPVARVSVAMPRGFHVQVSLGNDKWPRKGTEDAKHMKEIGEHGPRSTVAGQRFTSLALFASFVPFRGQPSVCNAQEVRGVRSSTWCIARFASGGAGGFGRFADWKSAIRQGGNPRYRDGAARTLERKN